MHLVYISVFPLVVLLVYSVIASGLVRGHHSLMKSPFMLLFLTYRTSNEVRVMIPNPETLVNKTSDKFSPVDIFVHAFSNFDAHRDGHFEKCLLLTNL